MTPIHRRLVLALASTSFAFGAGAVQANDFPTVDRVLYVQECMRAHPGSSFEMTNKCSCALDALATDIKYDDYVTISTISKAITIGGERGGAIRDAPSLTPEVKRYKDLQAKAEKGCFLSAQGK
ncbi:MAG: hypothetical protein ABIV63_01400 [Caldimonas sp.]